MPLQHKLVDVPVTCLGGCGRVDNASIWQTESPGIIGALPPDGWLINSDGTLLAFCCESCAGRLGIRCGGSHCENREQRRARKRQH